MEREPTAPVVLSIASARSSWGEGKAGDAGAVATVAVPAAETGDKVPLAAAAAPPAAAPATDPENPAGDEGDAAQGEGEAWEDEHEELGSCSRSPWCHSFVYSVFFAVVTFFVLMFMHRF